VTITRGGKGDEMIDTHKNYIPVNFNGSKTKTTIERIGSKIVLDIEQDDKIIRLYFNDVKHVCELMFFDVAEKLQPFMKGVK
jgi:hypothetical protein